MGKQVNLRDKIRTNTTAQQAQEQAQAQPRANVDKKEKARKTPGPVPSTNNKRLIRKEIQFEPELSFELTELRRKLNSERKTQAPETPTITDSILARVALSYLIAHQEDLEGYTEEELKNSLLGH